MAKGYQDKLLNPFEAIGKNKEMKEQLDQTGSASKSEAIWDKFLPDIMLALVRCNAEGVDTIPKKIVRLKKLMKEYGIMSNEVVKNKGREKMAVSCLTD